MQADITQGPRANEAKSIEISILICGINKSTSVLTAPTAKIIIGMLIGNMINPPKLKFLLLVKSIELATTLRIERIGDPMAIVIINIYILF